MAKRLVDETSLTTVANAIREKSGESDPLVFPEGFVTAIEGISTGGGGSDDFEWFNDGNTHIWVSLHEGRTSPRVRVVVTGKVTVDWGDGSAPYTLTGSGNTQYTPNHQYASAGDYIITLTVDGKMSFDSASTFNVAGLLCASDVGINENFGYKLSITAIEIGNGVTSINENAFSFCSNLSRIVIPEGVTYIGNYAFSDCASLSSVVIPEGVTTIGARVFDRCYNLKSVVIPESTQKISSYIFQDCYNLESVVIPEGVPEIYGYDFYNCYNLKSVVIPESATKIGTYAFTNCRNLKSIAIPGSVQSIGTYAFQNCSKLSNVVISEGVTSIQNYCFSYCRSITSIAFPKSVTSIGSGVFEYCYGIRFLDFSTHTSVPTLSSTNSFNQTNDDYRILVPAALYDEWIATTNWSNMVDKIVAV